ncbi:hypothetical protein PR048_005254, partial [Dryococelus australis]
MECERDKRNERERQDGIKRKERDKTYGMIIGTRVKWNRNRESRERWNNRKREKKEPKQNYRALKNKAKWWYDITIVCALKRRVRKKLRKRNTISASTRQKAKSKYTHRIRLKRASPKKSSDTHKIRYDRVKLCRERKIYVEASERVNDPFTCHPSRDESLALTFHLCDMERSLPTHTSLDSRLARTCQIADQLCPDNGRPLSYAGSGPMINMERQLTVCLRCQKDSGLPPIRYKMDISLLLDLRRLDCPRDARPTAAGCHHDAGTASIGCCHNAGPAMAGFLYDAGPVMAGCRYDACPATAGCYYDAGPETAGCWHDSGSLAKHNKISAYTRLKAKLNYRNRIWLERASQMQSSVTHKIPYDRVKWCRKHKININASEHVKIDVYMQNIQPGNIKASEHMKIDVYIQTMQPGLLAGSVKK